MGEFTDRQFIIHWLSSWDENSAKRFLEEARQLRKKNLNKIPHEELKELTERMYELQGTKYTVPVTIKGNAVFTLHYYPSESPLERTFQPPDSPTLLDADMQIDWDKLAQTDTTEDLEWGRNICLSVPHEEDLIAKHAASKMPKHAAFAAEMQRISEKYGISIFALWERVFKFKECMDMDANDAARRAEQDKQE